MILAFTGTQRGMTLRQKKIVKDMLAYFNPNLVRHGGCIGADEEFHQLCLDQMVALIQVWPSDVVGKVAKLASYTANTSVVYEKPKPPMLRNMDIVAGSGHLIACPAEAEEVLRSGTWATVRLSTRYNIPCTVIKPTDAPTADERRLG
jgi:hypothetical protein